MYNIAHVRETHEKLIDFYIVLCCVDISGNPNRIRPAHTVPHFTRRGHGRRRSGEWLSSQILDPTNVMRRTLTTMLLKSTTTISFSMSSRLKGRE